MDMTKSMFELLAQRGEGLDIVDHGSAPLACIGVGHVQTVRPSAEVGRAVGELERFLAGPSILPTTCEGPTQGPGLTSAGSADPAAVDVRPRGCEAPSAGSHMTSTPHSDSTRKVASWTSSHSSFSHTRMAGLPTVYLHLSSSSQERCAREGVQRTALGSRRAPCAKWT